MTNQLNAAREESNRLQTKIEILKYELANKSATIKELRERLNHSIKQMNQPRQQKTPPLLNIRCSEATGSHSDLSDDDANNESKPGGRKKKLTEFGQIPMPFSTWKGRIPLVY